MLSDRDRELVARSKRILAKARRRPAAEQLQGLVKKGIINKQGRVQKGAARTAKKTRI